MVSKDGHTIAVKALQKELTDLNFSPIEGVKVDVNSVQNMFTWDVAIFGPPMTLYEGGYFKARLNFPHDYPYGPPSVHFITEMFHPNIYDDGKVCVSILHPPEDDPQYDEPASLRWNPTQNVRTILLSIISLLNEPNINSPANIDAAHSYQRWVDSKGKDNEYEKTVRSLVQRTCADATSDGVVVPKTLAEYCISGRPSNRDSTSYYGAVDNTECELDDVYFAFDVDEDDEEADCLSASEHAKATTNYGDQHLEAVGSVAINKTGMCATESANSALKGPGMDLRPGVSSGAKQPTATIQSSLSSQPDTPEDSK